MSLNATSSEVISRQVETGQLAVAGGAIAVISMVLEFIAMSGFAPSVSLLLCITQWAKIRKNVYFLR